MRPKKTLDNPNRLCYNNYMETTKQSKGVTYCKRERRYVARLYTKGKQIWLGQFKTEKEAATAYIEAVYKYGVASKLKDAANV